MKIYGISEMKEEMNAKEFKRLYQCDFTSDVTEESLKQLHDDLSELD